jgi:prepilin-type processing-associated H-X9-DG protein
VCASNLRGIGQALKVYANDNLDWYPVTPFSEPAATLGSTMEVTFIGQMGAHLTEPPAPEHYAAVHPSRALFLLVTDGSCTPKQFICLSSNDAEDDLRHQSGGIATAAQPGANRFDFRGYPFVSYGYQLPFGPHARPNENLDPRTAIMADKGPFFDAGPPTATGAVPDAAKAAFPPGSLVVLPGAADAHAVAQLKDKDWQRYNSPNHGGEGQNVLFVDGHVAFMKKPIVGVDYDNIYTQQSGFTLEQILLGRSPRDRDGPLTETDSIIVP